MRRAILVMAAGSASRMGRPKQLLPFREATILKQVLSQMLATQVNVFCVLGANYKEISKSITDLEVKIIENSDWKEGLGNSIAHGVSFLLKQYNDIEQIAIVLGDQPLIHGRHLEALFRMQDTTSDAIVATNYERKFGVPAVFPKKYHTHLMKLTGDIGARELLNDSKITIAGISCADLQDIDTPEDYQQLLANT